MSLLIRTRIGTFGEIEAEEEFPLCLLRERNVIITFRLDVGNLLKLVNPTVLVHLPTLAYGTNIRIIPI